MSKTTNSFSPEVRERAVRMVLDNEGQHGSRWQAITSISAKIGCSANTLNDWVKKAEAEADADAALAAGMDGHIAKPVRKNLLLKTMVEALEKSADAELTRADSDEPKVSRQALG